MEGCDLGRLWVVVQIAFRGVVWREGCHGGVLIVGHERCPCGSTDAAIFSPVWLSGCPGQAVAAAPTRPPPPLSSHAATHVIAEATLTVPDPIAVARALCRAIPCGADILRWIIHPRDPHCQATLSLLSCIALFRFQIRKSAPSTAADRKSGPPEFRQEAAG